jgi:hypothetical protein
MYAAPQRIIISHVKGDTAWLVLCLHSWFYMIHGVGQKLVAFNTSGVKLSVAAQLKRDLYATLTEGF